MTKKAPRKAVTLRIRTTDHEAIKSIAHAEGEGMASVWRRVIRAGLALERRRGDDPQRAA